MTRYVRSRFATALLTLATSLPFVHAEESPQAKAPSIEERLQRLEEEVATLRKENQQLRQELTKSTPSPSPAAAPAGTPANATVPAIKPNGREQQLTIGGFFHLQADAGDRGDSRFGAGHDRIYLRRARLSITGRFAENVDVRLDVELAGSLGETSGYRGQLLDGYLNWTRFPLANLRIGQFKTPYGFEQLASDLNLYLVERTLPNDRLTLGRQVGAQVSGTMFDKRLAYSGGIFNGTGTNTNINDNDSFTGAARISAQPWHGKLAGLDSSLTLGANTFHTKDAGVTGISDFGFAVNSFTGQRSGLGLDAQFHLGRFDLWGEYLRSRFKPTNNLPADIFDAEGWYTQFVYHVVPKEWQAVLRYESFDPNHSMKGNSTDIWTTGVNYLFGREDFKLMLNYLLYDAAGQPDQRQKVIMRLQTIF